MAKDQKLYRKVNSIEEFREALEGMAEAQVIPLDTETTGLGKDRKLLGISLSTKTHTGIYAPLETIDFDLLASFLRDKTVVFHNAKFDLATLKPHVAISPMQVFDTSIAHRLLEHGPKVKHDLKTLARDLLGEEEVKDFDKSLDKDSIEFARYACADADYTLQLYRLLEPELRAKKLVHIAQKESALIPVVMHMEARGIRVDVDYLGRYEGKLADEVADLEEMVQSLAGHELNLNSPRQVATVLYEELGLKLTTTTSKGKPSTAQAALAQIAGDHPLVVLLLKHREQKALLGKVQKQLLSKVDPTTGRIHPNLNQLGTDTGRFSCSNPNLQGIPKTKEMRQAFAADPGYVLLDFDYSQIEPRILAHESRDDRLLIAFLLGQDIYRTIMGQLLGCSPEEVTDQQRQVAKRLTLGTIYGMGEQTLAEKAGISVQKARRFLQSFEEQFPEVATRRKRAAYEAYLYGSVRNMFRRMRVLPDIHHRDSVKIWAAKRQAFNFLMQGAAGDIMKDAMLRVAPLLSDDCRLLLQIHDELIFEVREELADELALEIKALMEQSPEGFQVPLVVDYGMGKTWAEAMSK